MADPQHSTSVPNNAARPRPPWLRALGANEPPAEVVVNDEPYRLERIFKHDSWAATALYSSPQGQIVCKFNRRQAIGWLPMTWLGNWLARREEALLRQLHAVPQVPHCAGAVFAGGKKQRNAVARVFVPGHPLGKNEAVSEDFFPALRQLLNAVHKQNISYVDLHKRENILVGDDGGPHLIDFQIGYWLPRWWPANGLPARALLRLLQDSDDYHLQKLHKRFRPDQVQVDEANTRGNRPWWIKLHRIVGVPIRTLRRRVLVMLGVRTGKGRVSSEYFPEDGWRQESPARNAAA